MNSITENKIYKKIRHFIKSNFKKILIFSSLLIILLLILQIISYYNNHKVLKTSINYNLFKNNNSKDNFQENLIKLSSEKNFYGVLATLEKINIKLRNNEIDSSYDDYVYLLNNKSLRNIYKSAIATHGAYNFLSKDEEKGLFDKIENLVTYIDPKNNSYQGFKLEILYLLAIRKKNTENEINILYNEIQQNEKISNSLKERVKKIHEFEIHK